MQKSGRGGRKSDSGHIFRYFCARFQMFDFYDQTCIYYLPGLVNLSLSSSIFYWLEPFYKVFSNFLLQSIVKISKFDVKLKKQIYGYEEFLNEKTVLLYQRG